MKSYDLELNNQKQTLKSNEEKFKQLYQDISSKDEQLGLLKIELQSVLEKFKVKSEEVNTCFAY
jgi:hypothetical protein